MSKKAKAITFRMVLKYFTVSQPLNTYTIIIYYYYSSCTGVYRQIQLTSLYIICLLQSCIDIISLSCWEVGYKSIPDSSIRSRYKERLMFKFWLSQCLFEGYHFMHDLDSLLASLSLLFSPVNLHIVEVRPLFEIKSITQSVIVFTFDLIPLLRSVDNTV